MPSSTERSREDLLELLWRLRAAWLQNRNAWQPVIEDVDEVLEGFDAPIPHRFSGYLTWSARA